MNALLPEHYFQWVTRGISRALNKHGDGLLFNAITKTQSISVNPNAEVGIHTAVPHRYVFAYLTAVKSFLRYYADVAVYVHDDGSLREPDRDLLRAHLPGVRVIDRAWADQQFNERVGDEFLAKVRKSYTSYLKLFDPTLFGTNRRIVIVDTDVLFLNRPTMVIDWAQTGGAAWYHRSGPWMKRKPSLGATDRVAQPAVARQPTHIQGMVVKDIPAINEALGKNLAFEHGFNSGFIGYERGTVDFGELKELLAHLYGMFGDHIFRWGAEQTMHGLVLCGKGAQALPVDEYMVYTDLCSDKVDRATFVHFIGEFRYHRFKYPLLAKRVIRDLRH